MVLVFIIVTLLIVFILMVRNYKEFGIFSTTNWWLIKNEPEREKLTQLLACNVVGWFIVLVVCIVSIVRRVI